MLAALPYHATNEFVRLVQVLRLEGGSNRLWGFLAPMQQSGAALPREVLVQRCVNDRVSYSVGVGLQMPLSCSGRMLG
jgi:U3 small nucleolar RNA-associated protein 10